MTFSLFRSYVARRRDAIALKGRAAASAPSSYFWRVLIDFRLLMVCIFIFFLASSPPLPFHSRPFSVHGAHSLARHASPAPSLRRWCPLPGHASPERALSGLSWAFPGSDRGSVARPPGMGWTLRTGISPRGPPKVARGEVPKVVDCRTMDSFWVPFW